MILKNIYNHFENTTKKERKQKVGHLARTCFEACKKFVLLRKNNDEDERRKYFLMSLDDFIDKNFSKA